MALSALGAVGYVMPCLVIWKRTVSASQPENQIFH
jgi:hypothetical protein